jgi:CRP-like cAMP-binding protein
VRKYLEIIEKSPLFKGIAQGDLTNMLDCLSASVHDYVKHAAIFFAGLPAERVGIILAGAAQVVRYDIFGNRTILTTLEQGGMFGETFACAGVETLPVSVLATEACKALLVDYRKIIVTCPSSCVFHNKMIENMMQILARKNLTLNQKIEAVSARTTREKLIVYLTAQAGRAGSRAFGIPLNRQELADYLSVDRSAMSAELSRMRDDGILEFHKNRFEILGM